MKTPLQQFIDAIKYKELQIVYSTKRGTYIEGDWQRFFEMEKQEIIEAHSEGIRFMAGNTAPYQPVSFEFYNKKYNTQK